MQCKNTLSLNSMSVDFGNISYSSSQTIYVFGGGVCVCVCLGVLGLF